MLLVSLACSVASYLWLGFADALWMLFAARLLAGAGAGNIAAAQAYIADVTPPEKRAKGMGMIGAAFGLGFTLGPAIGGLLAGSDPATADLARPAFLAAALSALALVLAASASRRACRPSRAARRRGRAASRSPRRVRAARAAACSSCCFFVTVSAFAGMETTFALWANSSFGWGPEQVGWIFFYIGIVLAALQGGLIGQLVASASARRGSSPPARRSSALGLLGAAVRRHARGGAGRDRAARDRHGAAQSVGDEPRLARRPAPTSAAASWASTQSASSLARILGPRAGRRGLHRCAGRNAPYYLGALLMAAVVAMAAAAAAPGERRVAP